MREKITQAVFAAIDEVNLQLAKDQRLERALGAPLAGPTSRLDSLGFVNLVVTVEQKVEQHTGLALPLATDESLFQDNSPLRSVNALVDFVCDQAEKASRA